jgi:hypothetical protein
VTVCTPGWTEAVEAGAQAEAALGARAAANIAITAAQRAIVRLLIGFWSLPVEVGFLASSGREFPGARSWLEHTQK